jgi:hypothetical protein
MGAAESALAMVRPPQTSSIPDGCPARFAVFDERSELQAAVPAAEAKVEIEMKALLE